VAYLVGRFSNGVVEISSNIQVPEDAVGVEVLDVNIDGGTTDFGEVVVPEGLVILTVGTRLITLQIIVIKAAIRAILLTFSLFTQFDTLFSPQ
jgi:hypothetical protein